MATKLIHLSDDTLIEVEVSPGETRQISGGLPEKVSASFDQLRPVVVSLCRSLAGTMGAVAHDFHVEKTELEFGLSFEGEGNIFVTKAKAGANLVLKLTLTSERSEHDASKYSH